MQFWASHICVNSFAVSFLRRVVNDKLFDGMPMHVAKKDIPSYDVESGKIVKVPGIKLETFIFDVFNHAKNPLVLEVERQVRPFFSFFF